VDEPDAVLAARGRAGDRTALAGLVRRHQGLAFGVAYRLLGSPEDAEDIAQEAFVQVLTRLHTLQDPAAFVGWLRRVTVNLCLDRQRRSTRVLLQPLVPDLVAPDPGVGPEASALTAERWREVERELAALPTPYRLAVVLRDVEGLAYQEVASLLGVPEGTVKSRLHEGRRLLRQRLRPVSRNGTSTEEVHHAET
jgi:RNA polymerase sigma-70 factor (ECF subfamily)